MEVKLTRQQQAIVDDAEGHFLVRACPGSGKTFTIAAKTLADMEHWDKKRSGIALLSFTNVAQQEFEKQIDFLVPEMKIRYPHFVGTIDSFINKYVFFQFSYLLGIDPATIKMIGEPFGQSYSQVVSFQLAMKLVYALDGNLTVSNKDAQQANAKLIEAAKKIKVSLTNTGKYTQADANYLSLKLLRENPAVVDCISARFPFLYVDEAQDTTPIHWAILDLLSKSSKNERFGVIGDPDQSIYGWNGATPELFVEHEKNLLATKKVFLLTDSRRSSQEICNFYYPLSTLSSIPKATNEEVSDYEQKPTVVYYDDPNEVMDHVDDFVATYGDEDYLLLCRSTGLVRDIYNDPSSKDLLDRIPWKDDNKSAHMLLRAKFELDNKNFRTSLYSAEELIFSLHKKYERVYFLEKHGVTKREWFGMIETDLNSLPSTIDKTLGEWAEQAQEALQGSLFLKDVDLTPKATSKISDYKSNPITDYFSADIKIADDKRISTIHSSKGKTTDSVFLVLNQRHANHIIRALSGKPNKNESEQSLDEKRTIYVAITRARKNIVLCAHRKSQAKLDAALN